MPRDHYDLGEALSFGIAGAGSLAAWAFRAQLELRWWEALGCLVGALVGLGAMLLFLALWALRH